MNERSNKLISVIIPVYNCERYIARCLESILTQSYQNFEIVIINDGSTDSSDTIIRDYLKLDARIKYFTKDNGGVSSARNLGLDKAVGDYIQFIDGDDYLDADTLEVTCELMASNNLDCVSYSYRVVDENNENSVSDSSKENQYDHAIYEIHSPKECEQFLSGLGYSFFHACCKNLYRRDIIEKYSLRFAENLHAAEDVLFTRTYSFFIEKGALLPHFHGYNYWQHSDSCSHVNTSLYKDQLLQHINACQYLHDYLSSHDILQLGYHELSRFSWETMVLFAKVYFQGTNHDKLKTVLDIETWTAVIYPSILKKACLRRKVLTMVFMCSKLLFCKIMKHKFSD